METEIEVKFSLDHLAGVRERVIERGGHLIGDRILERTDRFDLPDGSLARAGIVLRLREATGIQITHKRPTADELTRQEVSVEIQDAGQGRKFLSALGYLMVSRYEKYRETFQLADCRVMLDELPFGCFLEIEGPDRRALRDTAESLGLNWNARVRQSYLELFELLSQRAIDPPSQATFQAFQSFDQDPANLLELQNALEAEPSRASR